MSENPETPAPPPPPADAPPPPPPSAPPSGAAPNSNKTVMLVLSYLWALALVPFLVEKEDAEVQWHAKHGLVLFAAEIAIGLLVGIAMQFVGFLGCILAPIMFILWLGVIVVHIVCIAKATKGERFLIPGLSQYADKF
ncbi:MAG: DUF4870 domain-containing protein [Acidobacteria bacterium]|nr:DUF4870 domain-containing protein [Acidobacteriota bacterium]